MQHQPNPSKADDGQLGDTELMPNGVGQQSTSEDHAAPVSEWNPRLDIHLGSRASENGDQSGKTGTVSPFRFDLINLALIAILVLALALRMFGTDWDQGGLYHPDERDFLGRAEKLDFSQLTEPGLLSVDSRLNPKWFNYGSLPLYALAGLKSLASPFADKDWNLFDLRFPGRNLSAIADTITVLFVYLLATRPHRRSSRRAHSRIAYRDGGHPHPERPLHRCRCADDDVYRRNDLLLDATRPNEKAVGRSGGRIDVGLCNRDQSHGRASGIGGRHRSSSITYPTKPDVPGRAKPEP